MIKEENNWLIGLACSGDLSRMLPQIFVAKRYFCPPGSCEGGHHLLMAIIPK